MIRKPFLPAACALLGAVPFCSLQAAEPALALGEQVVTATRTSVPVAAAIAATTVITREEIERTQAASVPDLLARVPGINIARNGGAGKNVSLYLRGTNANHVLVLIDGVRVGSATSGDVPFQHLPVELIERIEVVRGPRASLYGSEAIGGVIQIFTRRGEKDGVRPFLSAGYGTHHSTRGSAGVSGGNGASWYNLGVSGQSTEGISARLPSAGYEADDDGYHGQSALASGGHRFANGLELSGTLLRIDGDNQYDSGYEANADSRQNVYGARASYAPLEGWTTRLQAGRSEDKLDTFQGSAFDTRIDTRRDSLAWLNEIALADDHLLMLGADYLHDEVNGTTAFSEDSRDNHGVFVQYLGGHERHDWQLSLRRDWNERFGDHTTGGAGWGYALTDSLRLTASYGTAFKAPTFNQFYHPRNGNPLLEAEQSRSYEVGLEGRPGWGHWSLNLFHNDVDDLIAYFNAGDGLRAYNLDRASIRGLELVVDSRWQGWDWRANATLQDPRNASDRSGQGDLLPRRAEQLFNLDMDRRFGRIGVGASLHAEGRRWDNAGNTVELPGYATLDLRAAYWISEALRLQARVANLFDADYETAATYEQPGQALYLSVHYQAF